jgi:cyclophilin family peptidyl-prolyl cis-trans isomerase
MILAAAFLALQVQAPTEYEILRAEYERREDVSIFSRGLGSPDSRLQRVALRAIGRLERPAHRDLVIPFLDSTDGDVRREAVSALAQMGAVFDFGSRLAAEKAGPVRAALFESMGRIRPPASGTEGRLVAGLKDQDEAARTGAARGLETLVRLNARTVRPEAATISALREAIRDNTASPLRQFAMLALNAAGDSDPATIDLALADKDPLVRRLGVIGGKRWVVDPSPLVRFDALRLAGNCERALSALDDPSGHVSLLAIDSLGTLKCDPARIEALVDGGLSWRIKAHAIVALARAAPDRARVKLPALATDPTPQVRSYAAAAAKVLNDENALAALAHDPSPGVASAALSNASQAAAALGRDHAGLLVTAAEKLKGAPDLTAMAPRIADTISRLSRDNRVTVRDPRVALIERLREAKDPAAMETLRPLLADPDPQVAELVAKALTEATGKPALSLTPRYLPAPFPTEAALRSLRGATAVVTMKGVGAFTIELLPEEAPATVATFADLAEKGSYDGLTFHRVVPNFVLQGGSPGADEYDALTRDFMRDEVGDASHLRGTLGISTRGHDTGDGQIFVNLIDNWRLDHTYTVFARTVSGMDVVDRILEGDVIEKVRIETAKK